MTLSQRCRSSSFSRKLDLWSFLDTPRRRLPKYLLLLKNIIKMVRYPLLPPPDLCPIYHTTSCSTVPGRCPCTGPRGLFKELRAVHFLLPSVLTLLLPRPCSPTLISKVYRRLLSLYMLYWLMLTRLLDKLK